MNLAWRSAEPAPAHITGSSEAVHRAVMVSTKSPTGAWTFSRWGAPVGEWVARSRVARRQRRRSSRSGAGARRSAPIGIAGRAAIRAGQVAALISRSSGVGSGSIITGRVAGALQPDLLARLAHGRTSVVVTGTNGKTTTSHLLAAALGGRGAIAHNASGSNMVDGVTTALIEARSAPLAVLEVDELHLGAVLGPVSPDVLVLLNLSRDQLDRVSEVGATARTLRRLLERHPNIVVVANADDPLVVWASGTAKRVVWVAAGSGWEADTLACPSCGAGLARIRVGVDAGCWSCSACDLTRPVPVWVFQAGHDGTRGPQVRCGTDAPVPLNVALPGRVNLGNAAMALAAAAQLGTDPAAAAPRLAQVTQAAGRYGYVEHRGRRVRMLLVKNPAGWGQALEMLVPDRPVLMMVNAREADGRDVSWLWDLPVDTLTGRSIVTCGERAADVGVRLSYADIDHDTVPDPRTALEILPAGEVDAVVNYTAFLDLQRTFVTDVCGAGSPRAADPIRDGQEGRGT